MTRLEARCWLIGESNPYVANPYYALYHEPPHASGGRLQRLVLGVDEESYLALFHRRNTVVGPWSANVAREGAARIWTEIPSDHAVVLLGRKVWEAWCPLARPEAHRAAWEPFSVMRPSNGPTVAVIPHPSGLNRAWHVEGSFDRARDTVRRAAPWLTKSIGTLAPQTSA
jgi:hypothetical protein